MSPRFAGLLLVSALLGRLFVGGSMTAENGSPEGQSRTASAVPVAPIIAVLPFEAGEAAFYSADGEEPEVVYGQALLPRGPGFFALAGTFGGEVSAQRQGRGRRIRGPGGGLI